MNKLVLALSAALALGISATASAQSGTITFNGRVTDTTCDVTFPGSSVPGGDPTIVLPTVPTTALSTAGSTAGKTPVAVVIGSAARPCMHSSVALELNQNRTADVTAGRLNNVATADPATNVQVGLLTADDQPLDITSPKSIGRVNLDANGIAQVDFAAEYYATAAAKAGAVAANVEYTVDYN